MGQSIWPLEKKNKSVIELFGGTYSKSSSNGAEYVNWILKLNVYVHLVFSLATPNKTVTGTRGRLLIANHLDQSFMIDQSE